MNNGPDKLIRVGNPERIPSAPSASFEERFGGPHEPERDNPVHLIDYWRVLVKRRWIVLTALFAVTIITGINTWKQVPVYRASLKLQIDTEQPNILPFKDSTSAIYTYIPTEEYLKTQFEALSSRTLATRVIRTLKLDKNPRFLGSPESAPKSRLLQLTEKFSQSWLPGHSKAQAQPAIPKRNQKFSSLSDLVVSSMCVTPIKDSRVVQITMDAGDPVLASDMLNTLASEYMQMNFETKLEASASATEFLAKQLVDLKAKVEESEAELVHFGQMHNIYSIGEKDNVIMQKLADLNSALTAAQAERIQKESVWKIVRQSPSKFPEVLRGEDIRELESNVGQLEQEYAKLRAFYKPDWPELKQVAGQLSVARKQLDDARDRALRNVESSYRTAVQREKLLSEALEAQKVEANALNQDSIRYSILKREVDSSKQIYDGLLQRMKEAGVTAGLKYNNIHVVDAAEPPKSAYLPDKSANMMKALIGGLILGIALAFFTEYINAYFDRSVKTPDDIDRFIRLPFLGLIPSVHSELPVSGRNRFKLSYRRHGQKGKSKNSHELPQVRTVEMITFKDTMSLISEAYRDLRTSVLLSSSADRTPKSLLFTSSQKGEGKTTTCVNLAITLAQTGEKVLMMDCDMRNPNLHRIFGLENTNGVSTFLTGTTNGTQPLIKPTKVSNLFIFTAGRIPPNPAELVGSIRMRKCLSELTQHFDHILVDSPPLLAVTDARILATMVDGVLLVIKGGDTPREAVERSKRLLQDVHARILGTMLNNVDFSSVGSHYYSKYYYDYRHSRYNAQGSADEPRPAA